MKQPKVLIAILMTGLLFAVLAGVASATPDTEVKKLTASDPQPLDWFGGEVGISGDTIVIGAQQRLSEGTGAAYIFERDQGGLGNWGEVKKLTASDAQNGDRFGRRVAIDGNTVVVGARQEDTAGADAGAVYIFERDQGGPGNWGEVKKLTASDAQADDLFGAWVVIAGDTVLVAAILEDGGASNAGAVYVFERDVGGAGNWGEVKKLTASDAQADDRFGGGVSISGDTAAIAAFSEDTAALNAGAVYIFERNQGGAGNWGEVKKLTASDAQAGDIFGHEDVSISGDTLVVGAPNQDAAGNNAGAAYVFERDQGGLGNWGEVKKLTASDAGADDLFSNRLVLSGDTVFVTATGEDAAAVDAGAVYVFERDAGGLGNWGEVNKLTASDAQAGDRFGTFVAISGDTAVIGAALDDDGGEDAGAAYVFGPPPIIDVAPANVDFGNVEVGAAGMAMVTISNIGGSDLTVSDISLVSGGIGDFSITAAPVVPAVLTPDASVDVEITFIPTAVGVASDTLNVGSDDPDQPLVQVGILGQGVVVDVPPSEQIESVLAFFDASIADGSLTGAGPGKSGQGRLNALRNMIEASGDLIDDGLIAEACQQLLDSFQRTDGLFPPPDFVEGVAAAQLASLIQDLRTDLACP